MKTAVVIGAGYGGVAVAALLQNFGISTILFEAHSVIGGCASFFKRKNFIFDVGATTFSGVLPNQPVGKLFKSLGLQPKLIQLDPAMIIVQNGIEIVRKKNLEEWILECEEKFGTQGQRRFWETISQIDKAAWEFLEVNSNFINASTFDFLKLIKWKNFSKFSLLLNSFQTVKSLLNSFKIKNPMFESFLQEQLFITTQSPLSKAPLLTAAMGLSYPSETYYPVGGMYKPAQEILNLFISKGGTFHKNTKVTLIEEDKNGYSIKTEKNQNFKANYVVCNIPIWNLIEITTGKISKYYIKLSSKYRDAPAAFVLYFGVELKASLPTCYYQIHSQKEIPYCNTRAFFVSFSHSEDRERAPEGKAAVTISIHTNSENWFGLDKAEYFKRKEEVSNVILNEFDSYFQDKLGKEKYFLSSGTPKTFQDYTLRYKGYVGGIPHTVKPHLFQMPSSITPFKGFYLVGDTIFPGQGTPAVVHSALALSERILQESS